MTDYLGKNKKIKQEQEKYYREKINLRLKYVALISIGISIFLLLSMAFGMVDFNNTTTILIMRGFAGLFAIFFVVAVGIIVYRVNTSYYRDKTTPKRNLK